MDSRVWVTVLAGGIGSRFWPVSTEERPKQLLPLASDRPLIVDTMDRAQALASPDRIRILAGAHLTAAFRSALPQLGTEVCWIEPRARGTCPVLVWAAARIAAVDPDAVMVSLHADHAIEPLDGFRETIEAAVEVARKERLLVCVGVEPDRPETGYGYIQPGATLNGGTGLGAHRVSAFHEKPSLETATRYLQEGYLWNTGIFVWRVSDFLDEVRDHAHEVVDLLPLLGHDDAEFFRRSPVCVVDRAVMERSGRVGTVRASFRWDDVGSWEALARTRPADPSGNVLVGAGAVADAHGNIVFSESGRIVLFGTDDLVVVRTGDTTLVMPRGRAPHLKDLLARLQEKQP